MSIEIGNVRAQVMELKTDKPGVRRREEIKTGFANVNDYSRYLQEKYSYMNAGNYSMHGVPVNVSVSPAFLAKCNADPEKAAFLEENLAAIPNCIKSAVEFTKRMPGGPTMLYESIQIDHNGNISMISGCTNDPDGKIAKENAKRKAAEEKAQKEKIQKKQAEKKTQEKIEEKHRADELDTDFNDLFTLTAVGTDVKSVTDQFMVKMGEGVTSTTISFESVA